MKKILVYLLTITAMIFILFGFGNTNNDNSAKAVEKEPYKPVTCTKRQEDEQNKFQKDDMTRKRFKIDKSTRNYSDIITDLP